MNPDEFLLFAIFSCCCLLSGPLANQETEDFGRVKGATYGKFDQLLVRLNSTMNDTRYDFMLKPKQRTSTDSLVDLMRDFVGLGEPKASRGFDIDPDVWFFCSSKKWILAV